MSQTQQYHDIQSYKEQNTIKDQKALSVIDQQSSRATSSGSARTDKDGMYMRKLQLMNKANGDQNQNTQNNALRVNTQSKITEKINQSPKQVDQKWEELIISGRNIQNRSDFAAAIYDEELFVYGGYEINAGILSDFYKIDISSSMYMWEQVKVKNPKKSPGKLCRHSGVIYKNKMYLFGGQFQGSLNSNKMYSFDFASAMWEEVQYQGNIDPPCIDSHKALIYKDSMIVMSGYLGENGVFSDYILSFDFISKSWNVLYDGTDQKYPTFQPRIGTDICLYQDKIYVFGGYNGFERLNDLYFFNLKNRTWNQVKSTDSENYLPKTRKGHSLNLFGDHLILFGGIHDVTWELDDLHIFDLINKKWIILDEDSARRKEYQNIADISPAKSKPGQRASFKKQTTFVQQRQKSVTAQSPIRTQGSAYSPNNSEIYQRKSVRANATVIINDPYYAMADNQEQPNSPTRNLDTQKKKEFFQKKAEMLSQLQGSEDEEEFMRNNSNSPTSEAMKNALITIGNPMPELKVCKKGKTTDFGRITFSKFLQPMKCPANSKVGKKPCARDGHVAEVYNNKLYIFGGDRHKMSFNDLFALDLEKCFKQPV